MFTGIIKDVGEVTTLQQSAGGDKAFTIQTRLNLKSIDIGASIACSGVCLTVTDKTDNTFTADVSLETLNVTTLKNWQKGTQVNLEASLRLGDEMGGHIVSGHVDAVVKVLSRKQDGQSWRFQFELPQKLKKFIASKGSVALNGVSLTVNEVEQDYFGVNIIPHTLQETIFGDLEEGDEVNLEIDTLARYAARTLEISA